MDMLTTVLSVLWYLMWGVAALYVVMTVSIWSATLRTLGLSAIRRCSRMLRLSLRASPIRELSLALLLPLIAIPLIIRHWAGRWYIEALPLNALMLIAVLCFTLFLVPPTALVFSSSTDRQLRWALALKRSTGGRRVVSLLDTGYMAARPSISDVWSIMTRRSTSLTDVLRVSDTNDWRAGVRELIELTPIVVVDARVCTQALLFEASAMLTPEYAHKAIFVSEDDGACPVLERLMDEGRVSPDSLAIIVNEVELGRLLQRLVKSREALPKAGSFASTPSRVGECARRRGSQRPTESPRVLPAIHVMDPGSGGKTRLSTTLTPFYRWMARVAIVQCSISSAALLWMMLIFLQSTSWIFSPVVLSSLLVCNWVACALSFCLGRSLKTVYVKGHSLVVSDYSKES